MARGRNSVGEEILNPRERHHFRSWRGTKTRGSRGTGQKPRFGNPRITEVSARVPGATVPAPTLQSTSLAPLKGKHPQCKLENQLCKIDSLLGLSGGESGDQEEGSPQEKCGSGSCCGCHGDGPNSRAQTRTFTSKVADYMARQKVPDSLSP